MGENYKKLQEIEGKCALFEQKLRGVLKVKQVAERKFEIRISKEEKLTTDYTDLFNR